MIVGWYLKAPWRSSPGAMPQLQLGMGARGAWYSAASLPPTEGWAYHNGTQRQLGNGRWGEPGIRQLRYLLPKAGPTTVGPSASWGVGAGGSLVFGSFATSYRRLGLPRWDPAPAGEWVPGGAWYSAASLPPTEGWAYHSGTQRQLGNGRWGEPGIRQLRYLLPKAGPTTVGPSASWGMGSGGSPVFGSFATSCMGLRARHLTWKIPGPGRPRRCPSYRFRAGPLPGQA